MKKTMMFMAAGLLLSLSSVYATPVQNLAPGTLINGPGINFSNFFSTSTELASVDGNATTPQGVNASYTAFVYSDSANPFCANCLAFVISVTNAGGTILQHVTTGNFDDFQVDAGYYSGTPAFPVTFIQTSGISRTTDGTVSFSFEPNGVPAYQVTPYLILETNATTYYGGNISIQDDSAVNVAGFSPVPEPMTMGLLGGGLLLLGLLGYRRRKAVKL